MNKKKCCRNCEHFKYEGIGSYGYCVANNVQVVKVDYCESYKEKEFIFLL